MNHIVLFEPEIPQNTGNISRTCVATGTALHLIHPLGFEITDKMIKRAAMDYWKDLVLYEYENWSCFLEKSAPLRGDSPLYFGTTKGAINYTKANYSTSDCWFVFGKESAGIPEEILKASYSHCIRIPMIGDIRSLNLSNSVAIVLYEALRQQNFDNLTETGHLHRLSLD